MMITFGLTGGISCGKSTATKTFIKCNIPMIDADVVARQVVEPGTKGLYFITHSFGKEILSSNGTLDRGKLAELVFNHPDPIFRTRCMSTLNHIMAPLIEEEAGKQIAEAHKHNPIVGYDAALICEMGNADKYRPLIVVSCPEDVQLARLMSRNSLTREQAMARINAQMSLQDKVALADYVIDTSGTIEESIRQTKTIIAKLAGSVMMG